MTCIAGLVHDGAVYLAGDSAGCSGWDLTVRADPKVFVSGSYVMGFTTSFRMGQLLRYAFTPPEPETADLHRFMCTSFADALRQCLKDGGWAKKDKDQEEGGTFVVGTHGRLFFFASDYQVGEPADSYAAVGCGAGYALGALHATEGRGAAPRKRLDALSRRLNGSPTGSGGRSRTCPRQRRDLPFQAEARRRHPALLRR